MGTTPLWVPLVVAGMGLLGALLGTLGGVVITQRRSDRREALAWQRQRERERETWAREDRARTFEHRRQAYVDFYESLREMALYAYNHGVGIGDARTADGHMLEGWQTPTFKRLQRIDVYGTLATRVAAGEAYSAVWRWGDGTAWGRDDEVFYDSHEIADHKESEFVSAMRQDLSIPDD